MNLPRLGCLGALLLAISSVRGTDFTFINPAGGSWSTPANWSPAGVPGAAGAADTATMGGSGTYNVTLDVDVTVTGLTVGGGPGAPGLINPGRVLNITSSGTVAVGGTLTLSGGALGGSADVTVTGVFNWTGGVMAGTGKTIIAGPGTLNLSGGATKNLNRTLRNNGTATWTDGLLVMENGTFDNHGSFTANSAAAISSVYLSGDNFFDNAGTFTKKGVGTAQFTAAFSPRARFNNNGTVDVQAGTLALDSGFLAGPDTRVRFLLAGLRPQLDYGVLRVDGIANFTGTLDVAFAPGYTPAPGDLFDIANYTTPGSDFTVLAGKANQFDQLREPTRLRLRGKPGLPSPRPPEITQQPAGRAASPGDTVSLNVVATGSPAPSYQWRRNGQNLPGETGPRLVLPISGPENSGSYTCAVYNDAGAILSDPAIVIVAGDPLPFADSFAARGGINSIAGVGVGSNRAATREILEPLHAGKAGGSSVWISYLAPATGTLELTTLGSDFDTLLAVYTGTAVGALSPVVADDDGAGFYTSRVRFGVTAGARYAIAVDGRAGATGNLVLRWLLTPGAVPPPRLLVPPNDQLARLGGTAVFTSTAADTRSFQWFKDGVALADGGRVSGSFTPTLTLTGVTIDDVANYLVELRGSDTLRSPLAALQINPAAPAGPALPIAGTRDKFSDLRDERTAGFLPRSAAQPAGDAHPLPAGLARGISGTQIFSTVSARTEPGEPLPCGVVGGASQWLDYLAESDGTLTVDTAGSTYDTVLVAYYDDCATCSAKEALLQLIPLACNDNISLLDHASRMSFAITNGSIYSLVVDGVNGASGVVRLNYQAAPKPPTLSAVVRTADGRVQFLVAGAVGLTVRVDSSLDLRVFTPVLTNTLPVGGLPFIDPQPVTRERFFRAVFP